jgi:hypothetical protein
MRINTDMLILRQLGIAGLLALSSCSYFIGKYAAWKLSSQRDSKNNRVGEAKVIGVIELVNPEQNYVLINCEQRLNIPAGTDILAQSPDGRKTKLKVSPERKGNYITADITEGTPGLRDLVLYQVKLGEIQAPAPAAPVVAGSVAPLTPIMQADVIPPLDAPFQPMTPVKPAPEPTAPVLQTPPVSPPVTEPYADPSQLPPVMR